MEATMTAMDRHPPGGVLVLDQYAPGGVLKQFADAVGVDLSSYNFDISVPVYEQLRVATDPALEYDQHARGGVAGQLVQALSKSSTD
jgi:hypothetical protein